MPFLRKYGTLLATGSTSVRVPLIKRAVVDFALGADWTPAAGDVKVFVDGAAAANITNLPTAIASGSGAFWEFILTAAELTCKQLLVVVADAATKAVEDQALIVETYGNASAMYPSDLSVNDVAQTGDTFALANGASGFVNIKTETATILGDTNDIQTRIPSALVGGRMDSNSSAINNIATAAARLARSTQGIVTGTVGAASSTTSIVTSTLDPVAAAIDQFKGRIVTFDQATTTANLRGQSTDITTNTAAGVLTVTALTTAPVSGDTIVIT